MTIIQKFIKGCQWSTWLNLTSLTLLLVSVGVLTKLIIINFNSFNIERLNSYQIDNVWGIAVYMIVTIIIYLMFALLHRKRFQLSIKFTLETMPSLSEASGKIEELQTKKRIDAILECQNRLIEFGGIFKFYVVLVFWCLIPVYLVTNGSTPVDEWAAMLIVTTLITMSITELTSLIKQDQLFRESRNVLSEQSSIAYDINQLDYRSFQTHYHLMLTFMILIWFSGVLMALLAIGEVGQTITGIIQALQFSAIEFLAFLTLILFGYFMMKRPMQSFEQTNEQADRPYWLFAEVIADPAQFDANQLQVSKFILSSLDLMREMAWSIHLFIKLEFFFTFPLIILGFTMGDNYNAYLLLTYIFISLLAIKIFESLYIKFHSEINNRADQKIKAIKIRYRAFA